MKPTVRLSPAKLANLIVADGDIFEDGTRIVDVWVDGHRFTINAEDEMDPKRYLAGYAWDQRFCKRRNGCSEKHDRAGSEGTLTVDGEEIELKNVSAEDVARRFRADFDGSSMGINGMVRLTASVISDGMMGWGEVTGQDRIEWSASRTGES